MAQDNMAPAPGVDRAAVCAFEEAYAHYRTSIFHYVNNRINDPAVAEELTAEVFARLVDRLAGLRDSGRPLRAWLHVVARNLVIDYLRRRRRLEWLPLDEGLDAGESAYPPQLVERRLVQDCLLAALAALTEAQRQVIRLKFLEGYSNAEAGAILGKDENSVKSLQHRALASLRKALERQEFL